MITVGSFCTGYGGIELGLRLAGVRFVTAFHAEKEAGPSRVLKAEHPDVLNVGDITVAEWDARHRVDLMLSGDPCQTISVAGRREGRNDAQGRFLWPWVRRGYREIRPDRIFFENVANMTSHDGGSTMRERFAHLQADGYGIRYLVMGACAVGAPHHRHRWFALASREFAGVERVGGQKHICGAPRGGGRILLPSPVARDGDGRGEGDADYWRRRVDAGRKNGMPLGAAVALLPSPTAADGEGGPGRSDARTGGDNLRTAVTLLPTPRATDGPNGGPNQRNGRGGYDALPGCVVNVEWGRFAEAIGLWEQITGIPAPAPTVPGPRGGVRLNPALPEWMMGLRPGLLTDQLDRSAALKAAGNGVVPQQAAAAWTMLNECDAST